MKLSHAHHDRRAAHEAEVERVATVAHVRNVQLRENDRHREERGLDRLKNQKSQKRVALRARPNFANPRKPRKGSFTYLKIIKISF